MLGIYYSLAPQVSAIEYTINPDIRALYILTHSHLVSWGQTPNYRNLQYWIAPNEFDHFSQQDFMPCVMIKPHKHPDRVLPDLRIPLFCEESPLAFHHTITATSTQHNQNMTLVEIFLHTLKINDKLKDRIDYEYYCDCLTHNAYLIINIYPVPLFGDNS